MTRVIFSSDRMDWATPAKVFEPLHQEFRFTLDVCASATNHKVPKYFTQEQDGLVQSWAGERCWMNPPYGRELKHWIRKAAESKTLVVALVPSRTDTIWWHEYVLPFAEVRFVRGRIKFEGAIHGAPFPSALIIWGAK